ncbi:MAG: hypothetical protein ACXU8N_18275 [Telluria sp.]
MSLEQAITDHASALRELAAAIRATVGGAHVTAAAVASAHVTAEAVAEKAISDAKKDGAKNLASTALKPQAAVITKSPDEVKAAAAAAATATTAASSDAPAPTYDDVKAKVLALSKDKGREPTVQLLERHGVAKAPDLKPEQYADFIKDVDAIMAGTYNPEAAETV